MDYSTPVALGPEELIPTEIQVEELLILSISHYREEGDKLENKSSTWERIELEVAKQDFAF